MFPRKGESVCINPEWVREFDAQASQVPRGNYRAMKDAGFVGEVLIVAYVDEALVEVGRGGLHFKVYLTPDGLYRGLDYVADISYFVSCESKTSSRDGCPICGSRGWLGFNMFHCDNSRCHNNR